MRFQPIHLIIFCLTLTLTSSFEELHQQNRIMMFYEQNSAKPILHLYFNRHFKNSTQFKDFEDIITELYNDHEDYLNILYTDCNQDKQLILSNCQKMSKTKDNRLITGSMPSGQFRRLGDKLIQNPPSTLIFEHTRDVYSYDQLKQFIISLIPNFYQQVNNVEQYEDYLLPRYSPKLIAFITDQQEIPLTLRQIAVTYFLKFDFAFITDLNQQLLKLFQVKKFPSFVIVKYNFNQSKYEHYYSEKLDFSEQNYHEIKQFVDGHALQQQRNDILFHKIAMERNSEIHTFQTLGELEEFKQKAPGWIIIQKSDGKIPQKLLTLKTKYDKYFSYVNLVQQPFGQLKLYNPHQNRQFPIQEDLQFNSLNYQDFRSNMTILLTKDAVILGISEDYAHICGIAQKQLFRGHVRCLIISNQGKKDLEQFMRIQFKIGFIARTQISSNKKTSGKQTKGTKIMQDKFQLIYQELDWATRHKIKQTLDEYLEKPVSQPIDGLTVQQACFHPFKKCIFLLTNLNKQDRTLQEYLKQIAFDYLNNFIIYELDIEKNTEFVKKIGGIKDKKAQLLVYIPRSEEIVRLNKKITKNIIGQFMKANLKNDKRLRKEFIEGFNQVILHSYSRRSEDEDGGVDGGLAQQL